MDQLVSLFTDAYSAGHAVAFHFVRDEDVLAKDIVADHFRADYTAHDLASMNANTHVQVAQRWVLRLVALFSYNVDHLKSNLDDAERLLDLNDR